MKVILFLYIVVICFLNGCSTRGAVLIKERNLPLNYIKNVVSGTLPSGPKKVSVNGREFYSHPFLFVRGKMRKVDNVSQRFHAKITVLGDRRPYNIEVLVVEQKRSGENYIDLGPNKNISVQIANLIQENLTKRRGNGNIVDDFRAF